MLRALVSLYSARFSLSSSHTALLYACIVLYCIVPPKDSTALVFCIDWVGYSIVDHCPLTIHPGLTTRYSILLTNVLILFQYSLTISIHPSSRPHCSLRQSLPGRRQPLLGQSKHRTPCNTRITNYHSLHHSNYHSPLQQSINTPTKYIHQTKPNQTNPNTVRFPQRQAPGAVFLDSGGNS